MPSLDSLSRGFGDYIQALSAEEQAVYEAAPNHARLLRQVVLAWSKLDLVRAIKEALAGDCISAKTIDSIERSGRGSDRSRDRMLDGLNKGLSDRGLPTVSYDEVFPPVEISAKLTAQPEPINIVFNPSTVSSSRVAEFINLLGAALGVVFPKRQDNGKRRDDP